MDFRDVEGLSGRDRRARVRPNCTTSPSTSNIASVVTAESIADVSVSAKARKPSCPT